MDSKGRDQIGGIKPVGTPISYRIDQVIVKELALKTLAKLNPTTTKNTGVFTAGLGFQVKKVTKQRKRRGNFKERFTKMNEDRKVKDCIRSKMIQANSKIAEKLMKKGRGRKAKSSTNERDKKNDLTRTWSRDPMLAWNSPFSKGLALDQAIANELAELLFGCCRSRPRLMGGPHG